ncbi:MAG: iron-containing alcohol dehydrogenase [Candidatus Aenigmarchaeota archaeon]|nr:iron-containing alcohol dehydrogenase [Candidatus Aenigmarchaeota archaeon]
MIVNLPYKIMVEKRLDENVREFLLSLKLGKKCAIICDKNVMELCDDTINTIKRHFSADIISPSLEKTYLENLSKKISGYDFCIGLGGGRSIDAAKYSSFLAKIPWIAFPTILSHDGVVSSRASIESNGAKISINAAEPIAIIAGLEKIRNAPYRWIAAGAGDLISKISAVEDWRLAAKAGKEPYHTVMAELSLLSARAVMSNADDIRKKNYHGLEVLLWALISSGFAMNIYGSSRPGSGSEHNFSHALEKLGSSALHGEQVALGTIATTYLQGQDWKAIIKMLKKLKLPVTAKGMGETEERVVKALATASSIRDRYTVLNKKNLTEKSARNVLESVGII